MKKRSIILWFTIVLLTSGGFAQGEKAEQRGLVLKYDLLSLLGDQVTNSMGIRLGAEIPAGNFSSVSADLMYIFPCANCGQTYTSIKTGKTSGYQVSEEYRYYLKPGKHVSGGFYLGQQLLYQRTNSEMNETNNGTPDTYNVYRDMFALHALAGYQLRIVGRLFFDPSAGIGCRYISSQTKNKKGHDPGQYEYFYNKNFEEGSSWFFSLNLQLKIGLKL